MLWTRLIGSQSVKTLEYLGFTGDTAGAITYTFNSVSLGAETTDREIVICVFGSAGTNHSISSVTLGGTEMNIVVDIPTVQSPTRIARLRVPSGTTTTIVVTFSATTTRCGFALYSLRGFGSVTTHNTATAAGTGVTLSTTLNTPARGFVVGIATQFRNPVSTITGSAGFGVTDTNQSFDTTSAVFSGSTLNTTLQTGVTYSVTFSNTSTQNGQLAVASFV